MIATYEFYTSKYYGDVIPDSDFPKFESHAEDDLHLLTFGRLIDCAEYDVAVQKAVYNMEKRSAFMTFLNTNPAEQSASYSLVGQGVTELSISYNPQTKTEQFINQDSADTQITGYQPNAPVKMQAKKGDAIFEYVNGLRRQRAIGDDAITDIVTVDAFDSKTEGEYTAEKQEVSVQIDSYGGPATDPLSIGYTLNYKGDPVPGTFNTKTKTFTEATTAPTK